MQEKTLPDKRKIKEQAVLFAALADPTRLKLLQFLCHQDPPGCRCVNNLSHLLGITQPAVSQKAVNPSRAKSQQARGDSFTPGWSFGQYQ